MYHCRWSNKETRNEEARKKNEKKNMKNGNEERKKDVSYHIESEKDPTIYSIELNGSSFIVFLLVSFFSHPFFLAFVGD